jgi:CRP/FNR family transcriptional regulator, cyclic AMP receptor protein
MMVTPSRRIKRGREGPSSARAAAKPVDRRSASDTRAVAVEPELTLDPIVASAAIFQGLDGTAMSALSHRLRPVDFLAGHLVFAEGQPGDHLYIIISGKVKIGCSHKGLENLFSVMGPSDMFGELAILDPAPRTSTATTITNLHAVSMDREALRACVNDHPEIAQQMMRMLARRVRRTTDKIADQIFTDVHGRVAKQLLLLAQRFGTREGEGMRATHNLTQKEMAQLVGASREAVNKALADFAERGWIDLRDHGSVLISDSERLTSCFR